MTTTMMYSNVRLRPPVSGVGAAGVAVCATIGEVRKSRVASAIAVRPITGSARGPAGASPSRRAAAVESECEDRLDKGVIPA